MNRRRFLLNLAGGAAAAQRVPARPNVVLILADDLGWGDLSINGCGHSHAAHRWHRDQRGPVPPILLKCARMFSHALRTAYGALSASRGRA